MKKYVDDCAMYCMMFLAILAFTFGVVDFFNIPCILYTDGDHVTEAILFFIAAISLAELVQIHYFGKKKENRLWQAFEFLMRIINRKKR